MPRLLIRSAFLLLNRDLGAFSQPPHRLWKIEAFKIHDELEDAAAFIAAETTENLPVWIDVEAGRFFFVKRAKGDKVCAGSFERQIGANYIDDVVGGADLLECCFRKQ